MSKIPTQEQFNKDHAYPLPYGEDGDIAVGVDYTEAQALKKFREYWSDTDGYVPEYVNKDNIVMASFGWSEHPDYRLDEDSMSYCVIYSSESKTKPRYMGWLLQS